jgi:hypothetical protein
MTFAGISLLAACGGANIDPNCLLPRDVNEIIALQGGSAGDTGEPGDVRVYVDGSGSMAGFARAGQPGNTPFQAVIDSLVQLTASGRGNPRMRFFRLSGDHVPELSGERAQIQEAIRSPDFYLCRGPAVGERCSFQHSRTTLVFDQVARAPQNSLSIFLSDLWFSDDQITSQPSVALRESLARILQTRDIAIYGVRAPYAGTLADLPSGDRSVRPPALAFYLVVAGPSARIREFHQNMERPGSRWIRDNLGGQRLPFSIFSTSAVASGGPGDNRFQLPADTPNPGVRADPNIWRAQQARIPDQFLINTDRVNETSRGPVWQWPTNLPAGLVWTGEFEPVVEARRIENRDSCSILTTEQQDALRIERIAAPARAAPAGPAGAAVRPAPPGPMFRLVLDPSIFLNRLRRGEWLIVGKLRRTSIQTDNPATQWLRDWSFDGTIQSENAARLRQDFFPTLNVAEFARLMEYAVDDAARRSERPVAGFVTVVKVD